MKEKLLVCLREDKSIYLMRKVEEVYTCEASSEEGLVLLSLLNRRVTVNSRREHLLYIVSHEEGDAVEMRKQYLASESLWPTVCPD